MATCYVCKEICLLSDLNDHFNDAHNYLNTDCLYKCAEVSCCCFYNTFRSFKKHWLQEHCYPNSFESNEKRRSPNIIGKQRTAQAADSSLSNQSSGDLVSTERSKSKITRIDSDKFQNLLADKILSQTAELYATSCPRSQIQQFIQSTKEIVNCGLTGIQDIIKQTHNNSGPSEVIEEMDILFKSFDKSICDLDTDWKRTEALRKTGHLLSPTEFVVGNDSREIKSKNSDHKKIVPHTIMAIMFRLETILKKIFELPGVFNLIVSYKMKLENETMVIANFMQGKLWKRLTESLKSKLVFPIFLFYDDYEVGNAVGSHAGVRKLGGVYISLPCFPPEYQSSLSSMIHALLFRSKDRVTYGNFPAFRLLIDKLRILETEGVELVLRHGKTTVYFKLGLIIGDNAGLHSVFGLTESFNANYSCRFCTMDKIQRSLATMENDTFRRTAESYNNDLQLKDVSRTGIKEKCIFHDLTGFHITENLSVDIKHDLLEDVCIFDMVAIIKHYVPKLFTLDYLNNNIKSHDYSITNNSNIPTEISSNQLKNSTIKMSAAEMFTFVTHFGILVGHLIPLDDPVWQVYTILRQILAIATATRIQTGCSQFLRALVKEHHRLIKEVLGRHLRPKDHILLHMATVMDECGPLVNMWGMRFEAKHKEAKEFANASNSKINVYKTVSR